MLRTPAEMTMRLKISISKLKFKSIPPEIFVSGHFDGIVGKDQVDYEHAMGKFRSLHTKYAHG